jgi:ketosteroid isomerase-like protein
MRYKIGVYRMRCLTIVVILLAVFPIIAECATQPQQAPGPVDTVKAFLVALGNAEIDSIVATFAEDATVFLPIPSVPKRLTGRKEIREGFAPFLENIRSSAQGPPYMVLTPEDMQVQEMGTTAIVTFHLGRLPSDESKEPTSFSRRTFVLQHINGQWLIVHMHGSNLMFPPKHKG